MERRITIGVIDGQGGGIGSVIIKKIKEVYEEKVEIIALGTNAIATAQMMKAGANKGATGENAIVVSAPNLNIITGPISVVLANSMLGELTPRMADAISQSPAWKLLLPLTQEKVVVVGASREPLPHLVETLVCEKLAEVMANYFGENGLSSSATEK